MSNEPILTVFKELSRSDSFCSSFILLKSSRSIDPMMLELRSRLLRRLNRVNVIGERRVSRLMPRSRWCRLVVFTNVCSFISLIWLLLSHRVTSLCTQIALDLGLQADCGPIWESNDWSDSQRIQVRLVWSCCCSRQASGEWQVCKVKEDESFLSDFRPGSKCLDSQLCWKDSMLVVWSGWGDAG